MLIIPLHRALSRSNFPVVTAVLILLNCFIYAFLQSGDARVEQQAIDWYGESGLGRVEFPAFADWLRERGDERWQLAALADAPDRLKLGMLQSDREFLADLRADRVITPEREDYADWHAKRAEFERLLGDTFTERWDLHYSEFSPKRLLGSMFLHGSAGHLIGNMIFLALLGLLVEGALGPWLFLGVYLAGGIGAGLASLAWRWGDVGSGLGASGAIAGLMGAYCVLWGLRKVRVFYWFFVVFDYVRVPALALLPFWLGWELWQLLVDRGAHVAFDEHAGGIVCGAALAWGVRRLGWERSDFMAEDERAEQREANVGLLQKALEHIGRLEVAPARRILQKIDAEEPGRLPVLVALYRCACYDGKAAEIDSAAQRVYACDARSEPEIAELKSVWDDHVRRPGAALLAPDAALRLMRLWLRIRAEGDAEKVLRELAARVPLPAGIEAAWFAFAQRAPENSPARRERLKFIAQAFPHSEFARKAEFLLQQSAAPAAS